MKWILKSIILWLIEKLESLQYRNLELNENDDSKKILDALDLDDVAVKSDIGFVPASKIVKTQPYAIWEVETLRHKLYCADKHILFRRGNKEVHVRDLFYGDVIMTEDGPDLVVSAKKTNRKTCMYDIEVDHPCHRYYTDGILSHNTVTSGIFISWYICFQFDKNIMVLAHKMTTAREILDKIKKVLENLPFFMQPGCVATGAGSMRFDNGVNLYTQATTKSASLGFTIHLLYADEFAHIPEHIIVPFYRSIYPTLASSQVSRIIISSTANGLNLFHSLYQGAVQGTNSYKSCRVDWWEVPGRDEAWRQREIANLDGNEELFDQEYGNQFIVGSRMLIDSDLATFIARVAKKYVWKEIPELFNLPFDYGDLKWYPDFDPTDIDENDRFVFAIDVADGIGGDYTVINIMKLECQSRAKIRTTKEVDNEMSFFRLRQVGLFHSNMHSVEDVSRLLTLLIFKVFNPDLVRVVMETNFKGDLMYERVSAYPDFYEDIFMHTQHSKTGRYRKPGVKITGENRDMYCRELKKLIANRRIIITDEESAKEINAFGINKNGKFEAQTGHDDIAMSFVNTVPYFSSDTIDEQAGDMYELLPENVKTAIQIKIDTSDVVEEESRSETMQWLKAYM